MATYWVRSTGGDDGNDGLSYANAFATIATAFNNVSQGDTLNIVNDGDHSMPAFGDALTVQSGFAGTDYDTDPGLIIQGVDSSGNPALASVVAPDATNCYFLYNMTSAADYIWIRGIKFDYSFFGTNVGTIRGIFYCTASAPPNFKLSSCYFDFGELTTTLTQDTVWDIFNQATASNTQPGSPGTWVIEYCYFRNATVCAIDVGYVGTTVHHCIFNVQATNYSSNFLIFGGSFYKDSREQRWYNNTLIRLQDTSDQAGNILVHNNSDTDKMYLYNNVYYLDCGPTAATSLSGPIRVGQTTADKEAAGKMDYDVYAFGPNLGASPNIAAGGYGTYQFCELWRSGSTTFTCTQVPTNSTKIINVAATQLFNGTGAWTWTDDNHYVALEVDWDYRLLQERDAGDAGTVPGAVQEAVNSPPVTVGVTYSGLVAGVAFNVTAGDGLLNYASDPDLDTLSLSITLPPSHGTINTFNTTTGAFQYTPNLTYSGTDTFRFDAYDGVTYSNESTVTLNIGNTTPSATSLSYEVQESQQLSVPAASGLLLGASDPDVGQTISVTGVGTPSHGTLVSYNTTTGSFVYQPNLGFVGSDSFAFQVTDGGLTSGTYTASISVTEISIPTVTNVIDTAPFFKPTLEVTTEFRIKTKKNRRKHHDLANYTERVLWDESTHRIITLATNTSTQVTLGGVAEAEYLIVETDNDINVSINGNTSYWPVSKVVAVALGSVTSVYLQNESTTNAAQVILAVSD